MISAVVRMSNENSYFEHFSWGNFGANGPFNVSSVEIRFRISPVQLVVFPPRLRLLNEYAHIQEMKYGAAGNAIVKYLSLSV